MVSFCSSQQQQVDEGGGRHQRRVEQPDALHRQLRHHGACICFKQGAWRQNRARGHPRSSKGGFWSKRLAMMTTCDDNDTKQNRDTVGATSPPPNHLVWGTKFEEHDSPPPCGEGRCWHPPGNNPTYAANVPNGAKSGSAVGPSITVGTVLPPPAVQVFKCQ